MSVLKSHATERNLSSIRRATDIFESGIRKALFRIGRENVRHTRKLVLDKNKNGRIYLFRGQTHQASAPGEAPANMTGNLQKTVGYSVRGSKQVEFGDRAYYGKFLEDGTSKMAPRPHLSRTVKEKAKSSQAALGRAVSLEVKRNASR